MSNLDSILAEARKLARDGQDAQARSLIEPLLAEYPGNLSVINALAGCLVDAGSPESALDWFARSLDIDPAQPSVIFSRAVALTRLGRFDEALADYDRVVSLRPDACKALLGRGKVLRRLGRREDALQSYRNSLECNPESPDAHFHLANLLKELGRLDEAANEYRIALRLKPDLVEAFNNLGKVLKDSGRFDQALESYERAIALKPDHPTSRVNRALLLLLLGDFREGWREYEWRWESARESRYRKLRKPLWLGGTDIRGRRLFVWAEQGLGDLIQFCRYVPVLKDLGVEPILEVHRPLLPLVASLDPELVLIEKGSRPPDDYDFHCPLMSLPFALGTTLQNIPAKTPYLFATQERMACWQGRLGNSDRLKVGLAWSGSASHNNDQNRSLPLRCLRPLMDLPIEFHCLQKEVRSNEQTSLRELGIRDHRDELGDFSDTAGLAQEMDLVISVDTSVAHLSGAIGRPTWVLLPFVADHRWMTSRDDSPWYPTARLYRQRARGDWETVITEVADQLRSKLDQPPARTTIRL